MITNILKTQTSSKADNIVVGVLGTINIFISSYFGAFTPLLYLTLLAMFCDLITRCYAAGVSGTEKVESKKIIQGLWRKLGMVLLIILTLMLDAGLKMIACSLDIHIATNIVFTGFTLGWIFVRELISNLENLGLAGIELPGFVLKALSIAKDKIDTVADVKVEEGEK